MIEHFWECSDCARTVDFRQPELPHEDPNSEMNEDGPKCKFCGADMYFDEYPEVPNVKLVTPTLEQFEREMEERKSNA